MVIFHSYVAVYQRVCIFLVFPIIHFVCSVENGLPYQRSSALQPNGGTEGDHIHRTCHAEQMQSTLPLGGFFKGAWQMLMAVEKSPRRTLGKRGVTFFPSYRTSAL